MSVFGVVKKSAWFSSMSGDVAFYALVIDGNDANLDNS